MGMAFKLFITLALSSCLMACGGGGGGQNDVLYHPYETVYGDVCAGQKPVPTCTFKSSTHERIQTEEDPEYGSLSRVVFDSNGDATVYDTAGKVVGSKKASEFEGYVGTFSNGMVVIGVGISGLFWVDIRSGEYYMNSNGVLYSNNPGQTNVGGLPGTQYPSHVEIYGQAVNDADSGNATDTNFTAGNSETIKKIVKAAAGKLQNDYGMKPEKAYAVASALNVWNVARVERGYTTVRDVEENFKTVFGIEYGNAVATIKTYLKTKDKKVLMELTNRSSTALGIKPHQAKKFIQDSYRKALAQWGYNIDEETNW
jgi:hypothetical protein